MGKLLTWIAIGLLVWFGFKMLQVSQRRQAATRKPETSDGAAGGASGGQGGAQGGDQGGQQAIGERMVRCEHCGVHLPVSDAIAVAGDRHYCSPAHRDAGPPA